MHRLPMFPLCLAAVAVVLVAATPVHATDAKALLASVDKGASFFKDFTSQGSMEVWKNGSKRKTLQFDMVMKGLDNQVVTFTTSGDATAMKVLRSGDDVWVYTPGSDDVTQVAGKAKSQGFLDSEFTPEDMIMTGLSTHFDAALSRGAGENQTALRLTPKRGFKSSWSKIELTIDKTKGGVTKLRYFDGSGTAVREQTRERWRKVGAGKVATLIKIKNLKTGAETVITLSDPKVDTGVEDSLFSRRTLLR